jgi:hypothetical protein
MLRRELLQLGSGLMASMVVGGGVQTAHANIGGSADGTAGNGSGELRFDVMRNGSGIGYHTLRFAQNGDRLTVDIDIELKVKIAFVTVYRYEHRNREEWQDGALLGFRSRTNDNGTRHSVETRRDGDQLVIDGSKGRIEGPANLLPTSYWHRNFMARQSWIDTQNGRIVASTVEPVGVEAIEAAGDVLQAKHFKVRGDLDVDLWYADDRWVKLGFDASDGSRIDYRLSKAEAYRFLSFRPGEPTSS